MQSAEVVSKHETSQKVVQAGRREFSKIICSCDYLHYFLLLVNCVHTVYKYVCLMVCSVYTLIYLALLTLFVNTYVGSQDKILILKY